MSTILINTIFIGAIGGIISVILSGSSGFSKDSGIDSIKDSTVHMKNNEQKEINTMKKMSINMKKALPCLLMSIMMILNFVPVFGEGNPLDNGRDFEPVPGSNQDGGYGDNPLFSLAVPSDEGRDPEPVWGEPDPQYDPIVLPWADDTSTNANGDEDPWSEFNMGDGNDDPGLVWQEPDPQNDPIILPWVDESGTENNGNEEPWSDEFNFEDENKDSGSALEQPAPQHQPVVLPWVDETSIDNASSVDDKDTEPVGEQTDTYPEPFQIPSVTDAGDDNTLSTESKDPEPLWEQPDHPQQGFNDETWDSAFNFEEQESNAENNHSHEEEDQEPENQTTHIHDWEKAVQQTEYIYKDEQSHTKIESYIYICNCGAIGEKGEDWTVEPHMMRDRRCTASGCNYEKPEEIVKVTVEFAEISRNGGSLFVRWSCKPEADHFTFAARYLDETNQLVNVPNLTAKEYTVSSSDHPGTLRIWVGAYDKHNNLVGQVQEELQESCAHVEWPTDMRIRNDYEQSDYYESLLEVELTGDRRTDTYNIANSQVGYKVGKQNTYNYWSSGKDPSQDWCAAFQSWCVRVCLQNEGKGNSSVLHYSQGASPTKADDKNLYFDLSDSTYTWKQFVDGNYGYTPQKGDLVFFGNRDANGTYYGKEHSDGFTSGITGKDTTPCSHVAMVESVTENADGTFTMVAIEGNYGGAVTKTTLTYNRNGQQLDEKGDIETRNKRGRAITYFAVPNY